MHQAEWTMESCTELREGMRFYCFVSAVPYTARMLVEDLLEAGIVVDGVRYEEEADVGMKYFGGELPPAVFLDRYDWLRLQGMGGMDYSARCRWNGISFTAESADNEQGNPYRRILFKGNLSGPEMDRLLALLKKRF